MGKYTESVEGIKTLAARFEGIMQVASVLERIGSIEDAESSANVRCRHAREAAAAAESTLLAATNAVKGAETRASRLVPDAEAKAQAIIEAANSNAAEVISDANTKVAAKTRECADFEARVVAARTELETLTQHIAAARRVAAEMLGS